ncbi:hypothetical protein Poli38472_010965 [Pythium oligandrum]|uniref:Uncharacterized protein n=1 Tax=Pythium oligandrum TaxID=41045 RepID=A0A8K1CGV1_PYTOL|nr:hypothetical protein Poli38472_010965 [Pythium oligandrum]|eukprot:TMW61902.1 hypothetical protein Poli38472_010965 [Pythium oligandrum]
MTGFRCALTPTTSPPCPHKELFQPHYARTNLRKGDKILRCFPHCCPDHVSRSFCGSSLLLNVTHEHANERTPLVVFARFREEEERGLVAGDRISPQEIHRSIQSEANAHGEWIAAREADSNEGTYASVEQRWCFEVNPEARWYYHWESGVAKRHRFKSHVLEIYVFRATSEQLEVVAVTQSTPFRLISFRRATLKAVQTLTDGTIASSRPMKQTTTRPSLPSAPWRTERTSIASTLSPVSSPRSKTSSSSSPVQATPMDVDERAESDTSERRKRQRHTAGTTAINVEPVLADLQRLLEGLSQITLYDVQTYLPELHCRFLDEVLRTQGRQPLLETWLESEATRSVEAARKRQSRPATRNHLDLLVDLTAWLTLDTDLQHRVYATLGREKDALFESQWLRSVHSELVLGLEYQIRAFLDHRQWALMALLEEFQDLSAGNQERSDYSSGWTFETMVAQLREMHATNSQASGHLSPPPVKVTILPSLLPSLRTPPRQHWLQGRWYTPFLPDRLGLRDMRRPEQTESPLFAGFGHDLSSSLRLLPLLSLWRQFGAMEIQIDNENSDVPILKLSSLLNVSSLSVGAGLVLDHQRRWFRCFPSGDSTSALTIGGYSFGDYVANQSSAFDEIHVNLYAWRVNACVDVSSGSSLGFDDAVVGMRYQLRIVGATREEVTVHVTACSGHLAMTSANPRDSPSPHGKASRGYYQCPIVEFIDISERNMTGFQCALTPHKTPLCTHEEVFQPRYIRTNLGKGDKILRCFPHCCPYHVSRSFCGSSLLLNVSHEHSLDRTHLTVFARFREEEEPGLVIGDSVSLHEIQQSTQSDVNAQGQWITARETLAEHQVNSPSEQRWRFVVNPGARWYYHWESGAAKFQRFKSHVLEIYVFTATSDQLEVVAVTQSTPFRLISFRRASPKAVKTLTDEATVQFRPVKEHTKHPSLSSPQSRTECTSVVSPRSSSQSKTSTATSPAQATPMDVDERAESDTSERRKRQRHTAGTTAINVEPVLADLQRLLEGLSQITAYDVQTYLPELHCRFLDEVLRTQGRHPLLETWLESEATRSVDAARKRQSRPATRNHLDLLVDLTAWLTLDTDLQRRVYATLGREKDALFESHWLRSVHSELVLGLEYQIRAFLDQRQWGLRMLLDELQVSSHSNWDRSSDWAFETMVAQLREMHATNSQVSGHLSPPPVKVTILPSLLPSLRTPPRQHWLQGRWYTPFLPDRLGLRDMRRPEQTESPLFAGFGHDLSSSLRLLPLLSLWRQFGAMEIQIDNENSDVPILKLSSLLNVSSLSVGAGLVLDHQRRWFRCFPSGDSTSALTIGGYSFGDYVANQSSAFDEIHVNLYAWRVNACVDVSSGSSLGFDDAVVGMRYQLRIVGATREEVTVHVTACSGHLAMTSANPRDSVSVWSRESSCWPLTQKLASIREWSPSFECHLRFHRLV